jgi:hypothetical protein
MTSLFAFAVAVVGFGAFLFSIKDQGTHIDNVAWVTTNKDKLYPDNIEKTFEAVAHLHPLFGCSDDLQTLVNIRPHMTTMQIEKLAKYADAVTVCCCEKLGEQSISDVLNLIWSQKELDLNATAIGNMAYIALHHSDPKIREKMKTFLSIIK